MAAIDDAVAQMASLALAAYKAGRHDDAIDAFTKAIEQADSAVLRKNRAAVKAAQQDWAGAEAEPTANPDEVASIHRIAITELLRPNSPRFVDIPESDRPVIQVPVGEDLIHAPTGAVMYQFRAVAYEGRDERVDEYDQPVFAWQ